jgi:2-phospho-L-lactate/phosphoenolpyruvate guanylyltransferase
MSLFEVLIPIKATEAKTRLGRADRAELASAFLTDVLAACSDSTAVSRVHVVRDEGHGLNADLVAAHEALGRPRIAVILGDLPCLTGEAIDALMAVAGDHERWFVGDAHGIGTTILGVAPGLPLNPQFGARSRAAHRLSGAVELQVTDARSSARLRRDVDTEVDLWDAHRLGLGAATSEALSRTTP